MTALATNYRVFELPWSASEAEERRFERLLAVGLLLFLIGGIAIPLLPTPERALPPPVPEEVVKLVLQPPPPRVEEKKPEPKPEPVAKVPDVPQPPRPQPDARQRAEKALANVQDDLKELREMLDTSQLASAKNLTTKVDGPSRAERSLITSNTAARSSGGINTAGMSAGFGGGPGSLRGHSTQGVGSFADDMRKQQAEARRTGTSSKASRSREEIELVFDRNKAAIYALYSRALRDNPQLQGKVVVQLTIAPTGEVTDCKVLSSELGDPELERKLVARIKMFRFEDRDVELITTTKPIDFFPA
ncbi:MAG: AgmX/PglI C-terminal domain-containing protein [Steroidobacteraceae bacterium]|jgi:TonB family protein|nr:AgmX/PglI C-terminal domain-containing protein [Steroidobacteraceae bacterium]